MKVSIGKYKKQASRNVKVQIDRHDIWSLDHTLALIILPALLELKEKKHGIPSDFADAGGADYENQDSFDFYKESHNWAFVEKCKEWELVLDKMIWSFYQIVNDDDSKYHHGDPKYDWVKTDDQFTNPLNGKTEDTFRMVDTNPKDHWYDANGHRMHHERIREGLELFGKYYQHLWD